MDFVFKELFTFDSDIHSDHYIGSDTKYYI